MRYLTISLLVMTAAALFFPHVLLAQEMNFVDAEARAMGGTGVSRVDGPTATYWNPSRLPASEGFGASFTFGTDLSIEGDIISKADEIQDTINAIDFDALKTAMSSGTPLNNTQVQQLLDLSLNKIPALDGKGEGLLGHAEGGLYVKLGKISENGALGFHLSANVYAGAEPVFDFSNISLSSAGTATAQIDNVVGAGSDRSGAFANPSSQALADSIATIFTNAGIGGAQNRAEELVYQAEQAGVNTGDTRIQSLLTDVSTSMTTSGATTLGTNSSGVLVRGIMLREFGIAYGHSFLKQFFNAGVTLRMIEGETFIQYFSIDDLQDGDKFISEIKNRENRKKEVKFAGDVGLSLNLSDALCVGAIVKNLGSPSFGYKDPGNNFPTDRAIDDFKLEPVYRAGVTLRPFGWLTFSADADLTKTASGVLEGFESQFVNGGMEISLLGILKLRGGAYKNIGAENQSAVATGGIGLNLKLLEIDIGGGMSLEKESITVGADDKEIPTSAFLSASITLRF